MRLTVLGGGGAWPAARSACSGYLVEHDGYRLLVDPGYAVLPRLLDLVPATAVDAVLVSHGHPDHCADLNPLLRARVLDDAPPPPLPVLAPPGAVDGVLALDGMTRRADAVEVVALGDGDTRRLGPFTVVTALLPHHVPNLGTRISAGGGALAYTGDSGPDRAVVDLARDVDLLLIEATWPQEVPSEHAGLLCSARQAGEQALGAGAHRTLLTHAWPGTSPADALRAARGTGCPDVGVATAGAVVPIPDAGRGP